MPVVDVSSILTSILVNFTFQNMPVKNLLEINADKLFEEHTISEIIDIQKKLQTEIERKREELRTMVG